MKTNNTIDPNQFPKDHVLSVAMRRVSRHWFLAYSKLLSLEWEWDSSFPWAATDGKVLLLNPKAMAKLDRMPAGVEYATFLLCHESLHALLGHSWRCAGMRNKQTANVAADLIVNALIEQRNRELGRPIFQIIPGALLDLALSGDKSTEQLYRELLQPENQQPQPQDTNEKQDQDDSEEGPGQKGDQDPAEDGDDSGDSGDPSEGGDAGGDDDTDEDSEAGGGGEDGDGSDEGDVEGDSPADGDHAEGGAGGADGEDGGDDGEEEPDLKDFPGTGAADTRAPVPEDGTSLKEMIDQIEEDNDRLLTADALDRQTMSDSGQTGRRLAGMRNQGYQMPWTDLLREWLMHHSRNGWNSPFNHAIHSSTGLICSGRRTRAAGTIALALDTSGSVGQATYDRFLAEAQAILDELKPEQLVLISVSHRICDVVILEPGDTVPPSLKGGGGTAFLCLQNWLADNDVEPDVIVVLTDGHISDLGQMMGPEYPWVWVSTSCPPSHYPWGETIMVNDL